MQAYGVEFGIWLDEEFAPPNRHRQSGHRQRKIRNAKSQRRMLHKRARNHSKRTLRSDLQSINETTRRHVKPVCRTKHNADGSVEMLLFLGKKRSKITIKTNDIKKIIYVSGKNADRLRIPPPPAGWSVEIANHD